MHTNENKAQQIAKYHQMLEQWRRAMDLIGPGPAEPHLQDCLRAAQLLEPVGHWVDLGSGAGLPGILFAIEHPEIPLDLVESRQKRAVFLRRVCAALTLSNVTVFHTRTETLNRRYDGIISRAYKPPLQFLNDAAELGTENCTAICMLGSEGSFQLPSNWRLIEEHIYPVTDGYRKLWELNREPL